MADVGIDSGPEESTSGSVETTGQASLFRRLWAEFVGTTVFVAVGTGAATVLALGPLQRFGEIPQEAIGPGPGGDVFGALLANTFGDILTVAFAFATVLAVLVYALGGVSGAHFNPAVTISLAVARRFRWADVAPYILVQCLGGIAGAFIVAGIYSDNGAAFAGTDIFFGATVIGVDQFNALLAEAFIAFILVTAIMAVAVDPRAPKGWSGLIIGLGLAAGIVVTGAATGGSGNFARSLGPFVASLFYDTGKIPWDDLLIYAGGPVIGAAGAALVYESLTGLESIAPAPGPGAATPPADLDDLTDEGPGLRRPMEPPPPSGGTPTV
ncbi:MAG: aquaporin [Actinomycetota bacterium]|nr:aquaporin [Actinomycetota bacterium]